MVLFGLFLQSEDGIRYLVRSRGLGDVYKRQAYNQFSAGNGGRVNDYGDVLQGGASVLEVGDDHCIHGSRTHSRGWCLISRKNASRLRAPLITV